MHQYVGTYVICIIWWDTYMNIIIIIIILKKKNHIIASIQSSYLNDQHNYLNILISVFLPYY